MSRALQKDQAVEPILEPQPAQLPETVRRWLPAHTPGTPPRTRIAIWLLVIGALVAIVTGWYLFGLSRGLPVGLLQTNGRIESDVVNESSKLAGRIVTLAAREGDTVKAGAPLIQLDDRSVTAQLQQAQSALVLASARV